MPVYSSVSDVSIYVPEQARGVGMGKRLLVALVAESDVARIWTLEASIFREYPTSNAIHEACGFLGMGSASGLAD